MKKTTLLAASVVLLLLLNIATLGSIWFRHAPGPPRRPQPREVIICKLHLDKEQKQKYDALIKEHHKEISGIDLKIRKNKQRLYELLADGSPEDKSQALIDSINACQKKIEQVHLKHFRDIRSLCRLDQLGYYNELAPELPRLFGPPPGPHRR